MYLVCGVYVCVCERERMLTDQGGRVLLDVGGPEGDCGPPGESEQDGVVE